LEEGDPGRSEIEEKEGGSSNPVEIEGSTHWKRGKKNRGGCLSLEVTDAEGAAWGMEGNGKNP